MDTPVGSKSIGVLVCILLRFLFLFTSSLQEPPMWNIELDEVKFNSPFKGGCVDTAVVEGEETVTTDDEQVVDDRIWDWLP